MLLKKVQNVNTKSGGPFKGVDEWEGWEDGISSTNYATLVLLTS